MSGRGYTENPVKPEDKVAAKILFKHLIENQVTYWTQTEEYVVGDFDFYPDWNNAGLGVLRKLTVTGFLSEGSYHDYVPETYRLLNMDYKWMEAWHFTKAVMEYFDTEGFTTGNIAGVIYDSRMTRTESYVQHGRDKQVPLCGATVTLLPNNITYTTDNLYNGVYMFKNLAPGNYQLKIAAENHYDRTIDVTVTANTISYANVAMDRVRNTAPEVISYSPVMENETDSINCTTPIVLNFNWDMDTESVQKAFSIDPPVEGNITFEDSQLTSRVEEKKFIVVDEINFDEIKTKKFQDVLNNLSVSKALVVLEDGNKNAELSARNIADVKTAKTNTINVYDILKYNTVIATKAAVQAIEEVYA